MYGQTWFTLFSPRIQNYTIGLEPVAPDWGGRWTRSEDDSPVPPVMVATMDGPEPGRAATRRGCFRRPYEYAEDAWGIRGSAHSRVGDGTFASSWRVPLKDRQAKDRPARSRRNCASAGDGRGR